MNIEEQVKSDIATTKVALQARIDDTELAKIQARHTKQIYDAYLSVGFSGSEAIALICASFKSVN